MVLKWRQREYDIATVKLLLFSYNIYLFNVLFLSYKPSFVFVHESIQKRQSTARIFLSYSSLIRSGKAPTRFASLLASTPNFPFPPLVEPLCGLMNTGGAFKRSVDPHNERKLSFPLLLFGSAKQPCSFASSSLRYLSLVESCQIWETLHRPQRNGEKSWDLSVQKFDPNIF